MQDPRCVRAARCEDRQVGVDPDTGERAMLGAETAHDRPLCDTCIRYLRYALGSLHLDVAELTNLLQPSMQINLRDPDMPDQPKVKLHAPLPFNGSAEALRAFIDNETVAWAEAVTTDIAWQWDPQWVVSTRIGFRVQHLAAFLADQALSLLGLPAARRRTYSTGVDAADGHDPDEATAHAGYVLTTRDGCDAALTFLRVHEQVRAFAGRIPSDRLRLPCPLCHQLSLHREHHKAHTDSRGVESHGRVVCRNRQCWLVLADHEYEELRRAAARAFGVHL